MKHVSITSLLCGTAIILAPIIHDLISVAMLAHLLALDPEQNIHLTGTLGGDYQNWCLFIGLCLLFTGTVLGFRSNSRAGSQTTQAASPHPLAQPSNA